MKKPIVLAFIVVLALLAAGCASPSAPAPTPTPTVAATPTPLATAAPNIVVTLPPGTPATTVTVIHYVHGAITYNNQPTSNYHVLVETDKGNGYGNSTDANGIFNVTFPDDGSTTYTLQLADSGGNLVYRDDKPRYLNATGPMSISIEVPATNRMNVTIK